MVKRLKKLYTYINKNSLQSLEFTTLSDLKFTIQTRKKIYHFSKGPSKFPFNRREEPRNGKQIQIEARLKR